MNLAILSKIGGASAFVGSSGLLLVMILFPKYLGFNSNAHIYAIGETVSSGQVSTPEIKHNKDKNYQCKFSNDVIVDCTIEEWDAGTTNDKKQYKISSLTNSTYKPITNTTIAEKDKIFHIVISGNLWKKEFKEKNIEVIVDTKSTQIYAKLKPIFGTYEGEQIVQTSYFVGTAKSSDTIQDSDSYKCSFANSDGSKSNTNYDCKITKFTETETEEQMKQQYDQLQFKKPETTDKLQKLETHKRYLIQFTSEKKYVDNFKENIIFNNNTTNKSVEFESVKGVFYDGVHDYIFTF